MKITVQNKEYELEDLHITGNSAEESELSINFCILDKSIVYYTSADKFFTKIKKNIKANPQGWKITDLYFMPNGKLSGIRATGPVNSLTIRTGKALEMSEEKKQKLTSHLKALHAAAKKKKASQPNT